jgi:hypothetical protein
LLRAPRVRAVVLVSLVVGLLAAVPTAQASFVRAPKWLKGPYRQYVLTYDATAMARGHEVDTTSDGPQHGCYADGTYDDATTSHYAVTYQFLFGRYTPPGKRSHVAFVWRQTHRAAAGQWKGTYDSSPPAGCPDDPDQHVHTSCIAFVHENSPPELGIDDRPRSSYVAMLNVTLERRGGGCTTSDPNSTPSGVPGSHYQDVDPSDGTIRFDARGVMAGRTFRGNVQLPAGIHSGHGSEDNYGWQHIEWTFDAGLSAKFVLAPVRR